jgi:hypothetical protein
MRKLFTLLLLLISISVFSQTRNIVPNSGHTGNLGTKQHGLFWLNVYTDSLNGKLVTNYRLQNNHDSLSTLQEKSYNSLDNKPTLGTASAQDVGYFDLAGVGHTEAGAHVTAHENSFTHSNIAVTYGWGDHAQAGYLLKTDTANMLTKYVRKLNPTFAGSITGSYLTASEILITDANKKIVSAAVATYPSLTELSYVKGLSSAVQAQIGNKANTADPTFTTGITTPLVTLPTNGQILLTVPTTDGHATGNITNAFVSGYTSSSIGDLVYLDVNSKWQKTDMGTSVATYSGFLGIALEVKDTDQAMKVALSGSFVYATGFPALTIGSPVWMGDAGAIVVTRPSTADHAVRMIGWAVHADKVFFCPSPDYIIHL